MATEREEVLEVARWAAGIEGVHGVLPDGFTVRNPSNWRSKWEGWYRHITLAMLAHAYLMVIRNQAMEQGEKGAATVPMKN